MKFWVSIGLLLSISFSPLLAQRYIEFEKEEHDFGLIKEEDGSVSVFFHFINVSDDTLRVASVKASCGCTTPSWSKGDIRPGGKGFAKAVYNPKNRPGKFKKYIQVELQGKTELIQLWISGEVKPRQKGPSDYYPFEVGNIRFKTNHLAFGHLYSTQKDTMSTVLYNQGKEPIKILLDESELPEYLKVRTKAKTIPPGKTVSLLFLIDASKVENYGFNFTHFTIKTDDVKNPNKRINLSIDIKEYFAGLTKKEREDAPKVKWEKTKHNFGKIPQGDKVKTTFKLSNIGKSDLIIRSTRPSCGCTASEVKQKTVAPGESTEIEVSFDSTGRKGLQTKSVTVILNDPDQAVTNLSIIADVQTK